MKALLLQAITIVSFLVPLSAAQNTIVPAEIQNLNVARNGDQLNIEITLTSAVTPNVIVATGPDRLVLELPNTSAEARQKRIAVNQDGVKALRVGLNSANPPVTRVVIDLEQAHAYRVSTNGNTIVLAILPAENSHARHDAPAPAASAPIWGRLRPQKRQSVPAPPNQSSDADAIVPPKPFPPIQLPDGQAIPAQSSTTASASKPSAAHPNYGSLQQGTVFPTAGSPGSGNVPPVSNSIQPDAVTATAAARNSSGNTGTDEKSLSPATTITTAVVAHMPSAAPPEETKVVATAPTPRIEPAPDVRGSVYARAYPALGQPVAPPLPKPELVAANTASATSVPHLAQSGSAPLPSITVSDAKVAPDSITNKASNSVASSQPVISKPAVANTTSSANVPPNASSSTSPTVSVASNSTPVSAGATPPTVTSASTTPAAGSSSASPSNSAATSNTVPANAAPATPVIVAKAEPTPTPWTAEPPQPSGTPAGPDVAEPNAANPELATRQPNSDIHMGFKIKYVAAGAAYLEGGRNTGLSEGMKLEVRDNRSGAESGTNEAYGPVVADLEILSVADTSTVAEIHEPQRDVKAGDWAYLSSEDTQTLVAQRSLSPTRKYPVVISFTEGTDPLAEEAHAEVPRPPMPDINRARGRFGFDYSTIMSQGGMRSSSMGMSVMTDITRIGGTYWNMTGYWRGRFNSTSGSQTQTLQDLINRTYHLGMFYDNPESHFVAGFGRLFLPYATSLDTIDGGYVGFRMTKTATIGLFAGSTPDPTSWSYNPQQEIGGTFVNFQGGSFEDFRYTDTFGVGVEMLKWKINRPFVFGENTLSYKRLVSIYSAIQADSPAGNAAVSAPGAGLSRSFTTFRIQPFSRIEFDVNHTYFRDIPTFDPNLIGTGLLDKYLFQGFSAGTRIEVLKDIFLYTTMGRSNRSGDKSSSLNQLYGITLGHVPHTRIRTDLHWSKFSSSFGSGTYEAASVSRSFHDNFRWEVLAGKQSFVSSLSTNDSSHFFTGNLDLPIGSHYYMQSGFTWNRGAGQNYNQMLFSFGYRFDTRKAGSR